MTRMIRKYAQVRSASRSKPTCLFSVFVVWRRGGIEEAMLSHSPSEITATGRRQEEEEEEEDGSSPPSSCMFQQGCAGSTRVLESNRDTSHTAASCSDFPSLSGASGIVFFRTVVFDWTLVFRLSSDAPAAVDNHLTACFFFPFKSRDKVSHFRRCQRFPKRQKAGVQTFYDL